MVHNEVRQYVANQDIRSLKFWFKGSLDGDPTFQKYEEDYAYCKEAIPQLFEAYQELTPLSLAHVDASYWTQLKNDLMENFSEKRFQHMKQAAQIFYHKRITGIQQEAEQSAVSDEPMLIHSQVAAQAEKEYQDNEEAMRRQQQADAERIARLRAENAAKQRQTSEELARRMQKSAPAQQYQAPQENNQPKKASGLNYPFLIAVIIIIILIIIIISGQKPA